MHECTIETTEGPDVTFTGEQVAHVSSKDDAHPDASKYSTMTLYRTDGGSWVCVRRQLYMDTDAEKSCSVVVAATVAELLEQLGYRWLAKDLYEEAGIEHAKRVE